MRNRFLINIIFLFLSNISFGQKSIEKLETDKDVEKFIRYNMSSDDPNSVWRNFTLIDGDEWQGLYNINQNLEDSLSKINVVKWQTADFDFDKKLDLIVCGKIPMGGKNEFHVLVFLTDEDGGYKIKEMIPEEFQTYPNYFSLMILPKKDVTAIRLVKWYPDINNPSPNGLPYTIDTLAFAQEYIVNYNAHPDSASFKSVKLKGLEVDGRIAEVVLQNLDKGNIANFTIKIHRKANDSATIKGKITQAVYAELLSFINYAGFKEMPPVFQSNSNLNQTFILNVEYADGSTKELTDLSGGGTATLESIYNWFAWLIDYSTRYSAVMRKNRDVN